MIKLFRITNHVGESIEFELTHPEKSGFIVESVDGLGPVKATINITEVITNDGGIYNSARSSVRNLVFRLKFLQTDEETIEDVRQKSYKFFPLKKSIQVFIETDNRSLTCEGYVESNEPDIFSKQSGTQVSIICPDPYLYTTGLNVENISDIQPMFEFPFENLSLTEPKLELSRITEKAQHEIIYEGEVDIGVSMLIHAKGEVNNITIHNLNTREKMMIDTDKIRSLTSVPFSEGDTIHICTKKNNKRILLIRNGESYNILNCLKRDSKWFVLTKGINNFAYTAESGSENLEFLVSNETIYDGV